MYFGPEAGDKLVLNSSTVSELGLDTKEVTVLAIFKSLDENWDPWGELAWAQIDSDNAHGQKGNYYAVCSRPDDPSETFSVADYEVFAWTGG